MRMPRRPRHGDQGTSLLIVLMIVTGVSLVMGAIVDQVDTSVRSGVTLRDQASDNYGADAGTQAVLTGLKNSGINCSDPANPVGVTLGTTGSPFYQPVSSQQGSLNAYAQCVPDSQVGKVTTTSTPPAVTSVSTVTPAPVTTTTPYVGAGDPTLPGYAILTTGSASGDFGLDISPAANNKTVCIENGSIGSNKDINASGQTLAVRLSGTGSSSDCTSGTGVATGGGKLIVSAVGSCIGGASAFTPTACTASSGPVATPAAPGLPSSVTNIDPPPVCSTVGSVTYAAFVPGLYTTAAALNSPCSNPKTLFEWLSPGDYIFDFSTTTQWQWPPTMVAGTPTTSSGAVVTGLDPTKQSTLTNLSGTGAAPSACVNPSTTTSGVGVRMIFGGASTVLANSAGKGEVCATSSSSSPPVAIQGVVSNQSITGPSGSVTVHGETLCSSTGCGTNSIINTDTSGQAEIYINGYVYAPNGQLIMMLKNSSGQLFNWGIVVRNFRLTINGASPTLPFVSLPKPNTAPSVVTSTSTPPPYATTSVSQPPPSITTSYTIRYINVWTCTVSSLTATGRTACPTTGSGGTAIPATVQVRVLTDIAGVPLKVLSWSHVG